MTKDPRYKTLKIMVETGNIKAFEEMFNVVPKTVVAADLGINYGRFLDKLNNLQDFSLKELFKLADFIEVDNKAVVNIVLNDVERKKRRKK
jgi:hypothetical protein